MPTVKVGIMGAAGYTGGELIRLLVHHPNAEIVFAHSNSNAGKRIADVHTGLDGDTELTFSDTAEPQADVVFLCVGHGEAKRLLSKHRFPEQTRIIDLSQDFRLAEPDNAFVYGLPEANREQISNARSIANPGCFATAIQLGLLPLAHAQQLVSDVHINATTGSTGAGQSLSETSHFSWRDNNLSVYKAFTHQHLQEIGQTITELQPGFMNEIVLIPQRGSFTRGILACMTLESTGTIEALTALYESYYNDHPFVHVARRSIDLKQVVNTNKCLLSLEKHGNRLLIVSVIDNLLKGASGQAVQNMNLLFGFDETAGLRLKASAF
jgi:N-acetyl-gamma-glutamyl-phosphate reductase